MINNQTNTENELSQSTEITQSTEDFDFVISNTKDSTNTTVITTTENIWNERLQSAISNYDPSNKIYSAYLNNNID